MNANLNGKKVAVVGLGISNIAVIGYLLRHDLRKLSIFDTRINPPYVDEMPGGVDLNLGPLNGKLLATYDILVVSPGISIHMPEIEEAAAAGARIIGDIELFAFEAQAPIVGITGSNGKSTVTALVTAMAEQAGIRTAVGANFGIAVFDILSDKVGLYVLELSSFELETTYSLNLAAGTILNVSEDHLDRYGGNIEKYAAAKQRIFRHCKRVIVNRTDARTLPPSGQYWASFGPDNQDYGREVCEEGTFLTKNGRRVFNCRDLVICGSHNELNAAAAMALADAVGIPEEAQVRALRTFTGLEHRCQLVRVLDGVSFYNDSKATNVASTQAAIDGLRARHPAGIILLAGGLGKGQDFSPLKQYLGNTVKRMYCFGRDADKLLALSSEYTRSVLNLRQALNEAFAYAAPGQAILLSPACASFDQFKGFEERGRIFVSLVTHLESREV